MDFKFLLYLSISFRKIGRSFTDIQHIRKMKLILKINVTHLGKVKRVCESAQVLIVTSTNYLGRFNTQYSHFHLDLMQNTHFCSIKSGDFNLFNIIYITGKRASFNRTSIELHINNMMT